MNQFTKARKDLVSSPFISKLDSKGRITVPSYIRKRLNISKDSKIFVSVSKPRKIKKIKINNFSQLKKIIQDIDSADKIFFDGSFLVVTNGRSGVMASTGVCGTPGAGSKQPFLSFWEFLPKFATKVANQRKDLQEKKLRSNLWNKKRSENLACGPISKRGNSK